MSFRNFFTSTLDLHRAARFKFVPWMARFFTEGPVRGDSRTLPVGKAAALTDETIAAVAEISNRVCWRFLARECGWRKLDAVHPENPETHSIRRLWQREAFLPDLEFSAATPDLLLTIYNETRKNGDLEKIKMPDCLRRNGDMLVHHLVFRRLRDTPRAFGLQKDHCRDQWLSNPLNAMHDPAGFRSFSPERVRWDRLCEGDLAPFAPWIGIRQVELWDRDSRPFWNGGVAERLDWLEALTFLMTDWGLQAEKAGRIDLATFLLDLLASHHRRGEENQAGFRRRTAGLSFRETRELVTRWTDFLALTQPLEESARRCSAVHPVERTGPEKCFLARWESLGFTETVAGLRELSRALRPSIH